MITQDIKKLEIKDALMLIAEAIEELQEKCKDIRLPESHICEVSKWDLDNLLDRIISLESKK